MKSQWIPLLLTFGLLTASPFFFQSAEATGNTAEVAKDNLPENLENLMDIAPEHQFILRKGSVRLEVELLQWTLNQYGLKTAVDGIFGPETEKNVRQYQKDNGLEVDGVVGVNTWVAIYGEY